MANEQSREMSAKNGGRWRALLALLLAISLAAAVAGLVWLAREDIKPWIIGIVAVFSFIGLMTLFCLMAGLLRIGGRDTGRQFFDGILDAVDETCVVVDGKGRAVYANASYLKIASQAAIGRLVGFDVLYASYPDFAEPIYQLSQNARDGIAAHREVRLAPGASAPGADSKLAKWLRISIAPVAVEGQKNLMLWSLRDISDDRAKQEQAFARLQFIITYLDHAPAGFFSTLADGKVDYVNATLAEWLGLDFAKAQAGELTLPQVIGEDGAKMLLAIAPIASGQRNERFPLDLVSRAGVSEPYEIVHRADFDPDGKALPSRTMVLKRSSEKSGDTDHDTLVRFVNAAPVGVAEIDSSDVLRTANPAYLALSSRAQRGAMFSDIVQEADRAGLQAAVTRAKETIGSIEVFDASLSDHKKSKDIQFTLARINGTEAGLVVFAVDKTESKALEVQLAQSQKMQAVGELASGIAHDFNNVLTPIIGFADLLLAKMRPTDPAFADIMNIKQNANRAANLVRQLLAFSRKQTLQPKVHSLTEAMSELGNLLDRVLGEKTELIINHDRDLGLVLVDIHQFEQVIINLAVNARDAMPKGGKLKVRTYNLSAEQSRPYLQAPMREAEYVVCEVEDTGSGIPPEILQKIWEPFFSTKEVGKGTGLGLSMVYGIVKQTGGYIFCDSEVGRGTIFRIFLPRHYPAVVPDAPKVATTEAVAKRRDMTGNGRILLVEDEDSVRAFAVRALTSRGYTVVEADSGERGLEIIEADEQGFELILSDVVMPEMDGPTMLRELRKRGIKTKVIFVSGYAEDAFEKNLEGQTDFAFLPKPFSLKQLVEKVKEVMDD